MPVPSLPLKQFADAQVLVPLGFHLILHKIAAQLIHYLSPATLARLNSADLLFLAEKLPSTVNALTVSVSSLYLLLKRQPYSEDVIEPYPELLDRTLAAHIGYTLYDSYVMGIVGRQHPSAWIHHVLGALGAGFMRHYKVASYFPAVFLPSELTVVATNVLWVMQKLGKETGKAYEFWLIVRCVLFLLVRAPAGPLGLWYALRVTKRTNDADVRENNIVQKVEERSGQGSLPAKATVAIARPLLLWQRLRRLPGIVWILTCINYVVFTGLNTYWTILVFRALFRFRAKSGIHHI
ncbi:uncharacterized protein SPPG_02480 [Spizellomyces punctatus DAOM BR117]|uniref:TLC domain-containing protein n=1 Tax=Spizellomyces punctatus (strain DAOM BR117) TaxID=645134 RepID=A0A0L0HLN8_SPIPD|nr:uncharacterized protein SPPG_02480 [Spizellomyces punctatus DAOM BR117]KND01973.1 hypothetical protein SPPG_02480 [Spizellomyces punctatus DAOM BR117]|eukprot:XP_016610012.1 hypothetical protein SPPG_02480 [Spizellomyces punctatus DAOM BR117]